MVFGHGRTSFKKAGFPDTGVLTRLGNDSEPLQVKRLGAGKSRDVYIVDEDTIVKVEVQAPRGSIDAELVLSYGGKDWWRTNEHEERTIRNDIAKTFSPKIVEPGLCYGHLSNKWGEGTPVCALFVERLADPDLQDVMAAAAAKHDALAVNKLLQG